MIYSPKYHLLNSRNFFKVARTSFSVFDDFIFERTDGRKRQAKATAAQKFVQFDYIMCEIDCNVESLKSQVNNDNEHRNEQTQRVLNHYKEFYNGGSIQMCSSSLFSPDFRLNT